MADDLAAFCAAVGIERPVVLGHSAGGFVALIAALRHPGLAAALALCDTAPALDLGTAGPPEAVVREGGPAAVEAMARVFGGDASPDAMAAFVELVAPLYFHPARRHLLPEVLPLSSFDAAVSNYFWTRLAARYDVRAGLSRIAAPTLVVVGDHDWVCPPVAAREVATAIPGAELVEVARSGHFPFSERPEAFHAAIASFLETRVTSETAAAGQAIPSRTWNSSTTDGVRSCARSRTGRR